MCGQQKAVCVALKRERVDMICMLVEKGFRLNRLHSSAEFTMTGCFPLDFHLFPHLLALGWVIYNAKSCCFQSLVLVDVVRSAYYSVHHWGLHYQCQQCQGLVPDTVWRLVFPEGMLNTGLLYLLHIVIGEPYLTKKCPFFIYKYMEFVYWK